LNLQDAESAYVGEKAVALVWSIPWLDVPSKVVCPNSNQMLSLVIITRPVADKQQVCMFQ